MRDPTMPQTRLGCHRAEPKRSNRMCRPSAVEHAIPPYCMGDAVRRPSNAQIRIDPHEGEARGATSSSIPTILRRRLASANPGASIHTGQGGGAPLRRRLVEPETPLVERCD